jgi:DNA polymerase-3 subunit alpha
MTFFGTVEGIEDEIILSQPLMIDLREQLEWERELLGLYVSDHPLTPYVPYLKRKVTHFSAQLASFTRKSQVTVAGMVLRVRPHLTKTGKYMGFAAIEDIQGTIELVIFPSTWDRYRALVQVDEVLIASGKVDPESSEPKVLVDRIIAVSEEDLSQINNADEKKSALPPEENGGFEETAALTDELAPEMVWEGETGLEEWEGDIEEEDDDPEEEISDVYEDTQNALNYPISSESIGREVREPDSQPPSGLALTPRTETEPVSESVIPSISAPEVDADSDEDAEAYLPPGMLPENLIPLSYLVAPGAARSSAEDTDKQRMLTVIMRSTSDKNRDIRRLHRVHGLMRACPGNDRFSFLIFENSHYYLIEYPNESIEITPPLIRKLAEMVGENNLRIEQINLQ